MGVVALTATPFSCRMRVNKDEWICRNRRFHACREERGRHVYFIKYQIVALNLEPIEVIRRELQYIEKKV